MVDGQDTSFPKLLPRVKTGLTQFSTAFATQFVDQFFSQRMSSHAVKRALEHLNRKEKTEWKQRQLNHLVSLIEPDTTPDVLHNNAQQIGRFYSLMGVGTTLLPVVLQLQSQLILEGVPRHFSDRPAQDQARSFLHHRIIEDFSQKMAAIEAYSQEPFDLLDRLESSWWETGTFSDRLGNLFEDIMGLDGMRAAAFIRLDEDGVFQVERHVGPLWDEYVDGIDTGISARVTEDDDPDDYPLVRAWKYVRMVIVDSCRLTPAVPIMWRALVERHGVRSCAAIPLVDAEGTVQGIIDLHHGVPGYFSAHTRHWFLKRVQEILATTLARPLQLQPVVPAKERDAWRQLLEHGALHMMYQPVVALTTPKITKVEALARLKDPTGRWISPNEFLGVFGRRELYHLFTQGLRQTLWALKQWDAKQIHVDVSINLPVEAMHHPAYLRDVRTMLSATGTDPARVTVEVLETGEMSLATLQQGLAEFSRLGVRVAQDDLGAGYSSLDRMGHVPFDEIKIDQHLVRNLRLGPRKALAFIHHLTSLGHDFGMVVIVEGLENRGLIEAATLLGADHGQGYGIARPMPAEDFAAWAQQFHWSIDPGRPRTALGAWAGSLLWHQQVRDLTRTPDLLRDFMDRDCVVARYISDSGLRGTLFERVHNRMHQVGHQGATHPEYVSLYKKMNHLLAERVAMESARF